MATETYRFTGMKNPGDRTRRIILEGSADNPEKYVDLHGEVELTEEEAEDVRKNHGAKLSKVNADEAKAKQEREQAEAEAAAGKRGADQTDPDAVLAQRRQQESQERSGTGGGGEAGKK